MPALHLALILTTLLLCGQAEARERIPVVGSAAGIGLIQAAAERFANHRHQEVPALEATGAALGFELFCAGIGFEHPDVVVSLRPITKHELSTGGGNGVGAVTQLEIGRDGPVLAGKEGEPALDVTRAELFAALAARIDRDGVLVPNPHVHWSQVNNALPDRQILVMAPEPNTAASHAF
jgi:phosphate transport system substrate-binding protein